MQAFKFSFQLLNCQVFNQWDFNDSFKLPMKDREKLLRIPASFWIEFILLFYCKFVASFSPHLFSAFKYFRVLVLQKKRKTNKFTSVFYASVFLLKINFVIILSKPAEPYTAILTMLWRNLSSTRRQTHKKPTLIYHQYDGRGIKNRRHFVKQITNTVHKYIYFLIRQVNAPTLGFVSVADLGERPRGADRFKKKKS